MSTLLWIVWVLSFAALEGVGLSSGSDKSYTLTNRVRALMRTNPIVKWMVRVAIAVGLAWLAQHFLFINPFTNPGN